VALVENFEQSCGGAMIVQFILDLLFSRRVEGVVSWFSLDSTGRNLNFRLSDSDVTFVYESRVYFATSHSSSINWGSSAMLAVMSQVDNYYDRELPALEMGMTVKFTTKVSILPLNNEELVGAIECS
jgi:hypothetical protein